MKKTIIEQVDAPVVREMAYQDPLAVFKYFASLEWAIFFDSAKVDERLGRYSFIAVDPFETLVAKNGVVKTNHQPLEKVDPFEFLQAKLKQYYLAQQDQLPPFQGGIAGYFAYDLCRYIEKLPVETRDDMQFPDMALGFYDLVIAFDQLEQRMWIISSGFPETEHDSRIQRAKIRADGLCDLLENSSKKTKVSNSVCTKEAIVSHFTEETYIAAVKKVIAYIVAGDIFEANISQRFSATLPKGLTPFQLYCRLRSFNAAPFAAYFQFKDVVIASASPERFLKMSDQLIESRPIKGTRERGDTKEQDKQLAQQLLSSEKDIAENIMIVDLMRNDLSKVCEDHSVKVTQLCALETYSTVHHLVSAIQGQLKKQFDAVDLLKASFPGGSITGAPKVRAMEIIEEIESTRRGPYCGSIGYINFNGDMDSSVLIRTYSIKGDQVTFQAGGAIVADSDPLAEYQETLVKVDAMRQALMGS